MKKVIKIPSIMLMFLYSVETNSSSIWNYEMSFLSLTNHKSRYRPIKTKMLDSKITSVLSFKIIKLKDIPIDKTTRKYS